MCHSAARCVNTLLFVTETAAAVTRRSKRRGGGVSNGALTIIN
jgi:hypothetical protein